MSRMFSNARYGFNPRHAVGQGASEASGALAITAFSADYQSVEPRTRRESLDSREQLTQARALVRRPPLGGFVLGASSIYLFGHFCQKSKVYVYTVHYRPEIGDTLYRSTHA